MPLTIIDHYISELLVPLRTIFRRSDQIQRFRDYLTGLIDESVKRKNIECIARGTTGIDASINLPQALQHFISHSPWDHIRFLNAIREHSRTVRRKAQSTWVIHEIAFAKKGDHSLGVQRQYARGVGKINCQLGIFISEIGPFGCVPLTARLYLPQLWHKERGSVIGEQVPEHHRQSANKAQLATELIEELLATGERPQSITAEASYLQSSEISQCLQQHSISVCEYAASHQNTIQLVQADLRNRLGLDHFEGRSWLGWHHHVSLVIAAKHLLDISDRPE